MKNKIELATAMPEKYRPSSGTEGSCFHEAWCSNCARDVHMSTGKPWDDCEPHEICPIIGATFAYEIDDPKYPVEWVYGENGPECTAFVPLERGLPPERCKHTEDMFAGDNRMRSPPQAIHRGDTSK